MAGKEAKVRKESKQRGDPIVIDCQGEAKRSTEVFSSSRTQKGKCAFVLWHFLLTRNEKRSQSDIWRG